jgi:hypothetical protein
MSLSGIFKNILLVICSVLIWHITITPIQLLGYSVTLCALIYYSVGREKLLEGLEASVNWVSGVTRGMVSRNGGSNKSRKGLWIALGAMVVCITGLTLGIGYQTGIYKSIKETLF